MAFSIEKYHFKTGSIIGGLPVDEFRLLKQNMQREEIKKNKVIFREGFFSKGVYILRKGKVKIFQLNKEGKEQIAYIYKKGEMMGYRPFLCDEPHPVSAVALEDCVISFIPKKYFLQVLSQSPTLSKHLLVNLAHEFSVWINKMTVLSQEPVRERVALILLILKEKYTTDNSKQRAVVINLSRENIASYARTTVETVVRMLRHFKDEKIIRTQGRKIIILKPKELEKIAESY